MDDFRLAQIGSVSEMLDDMALDGSGGLTAISMQQHLIDLLGEWTPALAAERRQRVAAKMHNPPRSLTDEPWSNAIGACVGCGREMLTLGTSATPLCPACNGFVQTYGLQKAGGQ